MGVINFAQFALDPFTDFSKATKRDKHDPYIMFNYDRALIFAAMTIPATALIVSLFYGEELYTADGLLPINPKYNEFDSMEMRLALKYCWSNLADMDTNTGYLFHYSFYPFVLLLCSAIMYSVQLSWRLSSDLGYLIPTLDYLIGGIEESIRDIIEYFLKNQTKPSAVISDKENTSLLATNVNHQTRITEYYAKNNLQSKFLTFNKLLDFYRKSNRLRRWFILRRIFFVLATMVNVTILTTLYLDERRNPAKLNCPIPPELYYTTTENNQTIVKFRGLETE